MMTPLNRVEPLLGCGLAGILKATVGIEDAVAIVHGPMSCASGHRIIPLFAGKEPLVPTTALTEIDMIMGSEGKLREALLKAEAIYHPSLLVIILTCATSLISELYDLMLQNLQDQLGCPVLVMDGSGITGDEVQGYRAFYHVFHDLVASRSERASSATDVELAGLSAADYGIQQDLIILKGLLETALGLKVARVLFHNLKLERGTWLSYPALPLGRLWFEILSPCPAPFGIAGTVAWVENIATELGREIHADFRARVAQAEVEVAAFRAAGLSQGVRVGIEAESWWGLGLTRFLAEELGCTVFLSSDEGAQHFQAEYGEIATTVVDVGNVELVEHLRAFGADLVFGSSYVKAKDWTWAPFWQPIWHIVEEHDSYMGLQGTRKIMKLVARARERKK